MTTTPTPMTAACDALLLYLLELEEADDPTRGRSLTSIGADLPDPLGEWVREHAIQIRTTWRHQGWILEPGGASLVHNDALVELTGPGRAHGGRVRELRAGVRRARAVRSRVLLFLYAAEEKEEPPFGFGALAEPASPWAWLADRPLTSRDIERALDYLEGQDLLTDTTSIPESGIVMARLSPLGVQAAEELTQGRAPAGGQGSGPQVVNIHLGDVSGSATVMQGRDVHGDVLGGGGLGEY